MIGEVHHYLIRIRGAAMGFCADEAAAKSLLEILDETAPGEASHERRPGLLPYDADGEAARIREEENTWAVFATARARASA